MQLVLSLPRRRPNAPTSVRVIPPTTMQHLEAALFLSTIHHGGCCVASPRRAIGRPPPAATRRISHPSCCCSCCPLTLPLSWTESSRTRIGCSWPPQRRTQPYGTDNSTNDPLNLQPPSSGRFITGFIMQSEERRGEDRGGARGRCHPQHTRAKVRFWGGGTRR